MSVKVIIIRLTVFVKVVWRNLTYSPFTLVKVKNLLVMDSKSFRDGFLLEPI